MILRALKASSSSRDKPGTHAVGALRRVDYTCTAAKRSSSSVIFQPSSRQRPAEHRSLITRRPLPLLKRSQVKTQQGPSPPPLSQRGKGPCHPLSYAQAVVPHPLLPPHARSPTGEDSHLTKRLLEEALVVVHLQLALNLAHGIQGHANHDEDGCATQGLDELVVRKAEQD